MICKKAKEQSEESFNWLGVGKASESQSSKPEVVIVHRGKKDMAPIFWIAYHSPQGVSRLWSFVYLKSTP